MTQPTTTSEPRNRFSRVRAQWGSHWLLWSHRRNGFVLEDGERIPGPRGYPAPWRLTHVRGYLCTLSGGCSWGKPYDDDVRAIAGRRVVRCWKCRSVWANWEDFQEDKG